MEDYQQQVSACLTYGKTITSECVKLKRGCCRSFLNMAIGNTADINFGLEN